MSNSSYKPDYSLISEYRTVLMGVAIIFILFCHLDFALKWFIRNKLKKGKTA